MARKRRKSVSTFIGRKQPTAAENPAPPVTVPTEVGAIAPAPAGGETGPATSAAGGETKTTEKQEAGTKK